MNVQSLLDWITEDCSPEAQWLRTNCEPCKRYVFDDTGRHELRSWTLRESPPGVEVTITITPRAVRAYCANGISTVASVDIPRGGKWRNAICEAIFWAKGFVAGWDAAPIGDDN